SSRNARAFSFVAMNEQRIPPLSKMRVLEVRVFLHLPYSKASAEMLRLFRMLVLNQSSGFLEYQNMRVL
ncbi:hypothetical protein, partial [Vibrio neptunius]|uniref:hypothetical protein n=1 Tax=Vibrio neptunius TaxID=170651 RepID=UPI001969D9EB